MQSVNRLRDIATTIANRLQYQNIRWRPFLYHDKARERLFISTEELPYFRLDIYSEKNMEFMPTEIKRVVFHGLSPMNDYMSCYFGSLIPMINRRLIMEVAKKMPSWLFKNHLYGLMGVNIQDIRTTIVSPNSFIDYTYPELIQIGTNSGIGEEAMLLTHFLYPNSMEVGPIRIGRDCLVGARAFIMPGVTIGDNARIGACAIVTHDVPPGHTLLGPRSSLLLPDRDEIAYGQTQEQ